MIHCSSQSCFMAVMLLVWSGRWRYTITHFAGTWVGCICMCTDSWSGHWRLKCALTFEVGTDSSLTVTMAISVNLFRHEACLHNIYKRNSYLTENSTTITSALKSVLFREMVTVYCEICSLQYMSPYSTVLNVMVLVWTLSIMIKFLVDLISLFVQIPDKYLKIWLNCCTPMVKAIQPKWLKNVLDDIPVLEI